MLFLVKAKHLGDSVEFEVDADDVKGALQRAKSEANAIFSYKAGDVAPTVSVKPVPGEEG